ncbi:hypothetical protein [Paenibacillus sp. J22TS3]|uniref:hypothetical protein n=1 Tax=Paenibacillus sp. J22TS3 TaxID=2807192 RepID=UPI001B209BE4|nr:hypothetical protein [Paenibacillus sp. J22TS3]GIP24685.1 hypothetical protein J22TS3_49600 [Paenibacillus sp. J22TS3]
MSFVWESAVITLIFLVLAALLIVVLVRTLRNRSRISRDNSQRLERIENKLDELAGNKPRQNASELDSPSSSDQEIRSIDRY